MTKASWDVAVVGAGVSGLTTAVCLAEAGLRVHLLADRPRSDTTSYAAGAIWEVFLAGHPQTVAWSQHSRQVLTGIASVPDSGVRLVDGLVSSRSDVQPPSWVTTTTGFRLCETRDLPDGFASGWHYTSPLIDMPRYLGYLADRLTRAGTDVEIRRISTLAQATSFAPIVVNCSGFGARHLARDPLVSAIRGELVVVANPGIETFFVEYSDAVELTYILPQGDRLVLGGSAEPGRLDLRSDPAVSEGIVRRCAAIEPALRDASILEHRVGLRPARPRIRVEQEIGDEYGQGVLLHNYGHGGAGVSVSWGCAREILAMVTAARKTPRASAPARH
jgi:D-amino-acid oxidase